MLLSIRRIFFNLKAFLLILVIGIALLVSQLFLIASYGERLSALKNQHLLIDKTINTDLKDPQMGSILVDGAIAEIALAVKLCGEETYLDTLFRSNEDQASLLRSLELSSKAFRENAQAWSEATQLHQELEKERMMSARIAYIADIGHMMDYLVQVINEAIAMAKVASIIVLTCSVYVFAIYRRRLDLIYSDIERINSVDADGSKKTARTEEIEFVLKRLARKSFGGQSPSSTHPLTDLNTEKGLVAAWNANKGRYAPNTVYLCAFALDRLDTLTQTLSKSDLELLYKKLSGIVSLYEQSLDATAHLESGEIVLLISRGSKQEAIEDCEAILHTMEASGFNAQSGPQKITLSAGLVLKLPSKSIEDVIEEVLSLCGKARENGGNRIAQLHEGIDLGRRS